MAEARWAVTDWTGRRLFPDTDWPSFDAAWEHVRDVMTPDHWEDIYVVRVGGEEDD